MLQDVSEVENKLEEKNQFLKHKMAGADQAKVELAKLIEQEGWILAEEQFFGRKGSMYDFTNIVPLELYEDV